MKKYLWIALGLIASLLFALGVGARLPSNQATSGGVYIQFDNIFDNLDPAHGYPVSGGHERWEWEVLEPGYDGDYRFTNVVRPFVTQQASRGKKVGLGIETAIKRGTTTPAPDGTLAVPSWLYQTYSDVVYLNPRGGGDAYYALHFLNANYQAKYAEFINDFADWLVANPDVASNVAWIEIGVGADSETHPADYYSAASKWDYLFYFDSPPINLGYTAAQWEAYVKWCIDTYYNAFRVRQPSLSNITLYLNCATNYPSHDGYTGPSTRTAVTDYAAQKPSAVGLKNNGLQMDRAPASLYDPLSKWGVPWQAVDVPIAWETYEQWLWDEERLYWGLLAALDKYPDVIEPDRLLMQNGNYLDEWTWAAQYLATKPSTTPGMWCALRDTEYPGSGESGNYEFYMFQRDNYAAGGATVFETNVGIGKEGRYTRRTDQGTGNPYIFFKIYNSCVNGNPNYDPFTVAVTYRDLGTDTFRLYYDSFSGAAYREVVKTNTNTWKKVTWVLTDARFGDGLDGDTDVKIDCRNDGDEWIHMVEVRRTGGTTPTPPTPTPSPTPTTIPCTIQGSVTLQGRPSPPDARWVVPLTVVVGGSSYDVTTDNMGVFTLAGLTPGTHDVSVKNSHTLRNLKSGVTLVNGLNVLDFGTLLEGDANNDNCVNITDFSILRLGFNPAYDARADFNQDGYVNITDFSLLKLNFAVCGDIMAPHPPQGSAPLRVSAVADGTVHLSIEPPSSTVTVDQVFTLQIQVAADDQPVDGAEVHLNFDPAYLEVVDGDGNPVTAIESGTALNVPIQNIVNNAQGHIDFAAGTFDAPPTGTFVLATIRLQALQGTHGGSTSLLFVDRQGSPTNVTYAGDSVMDGMDNGVVVVSPYYLYFPKISR